MAQSEIDRLLRNGQVDMADLAVALMRGYFDVVLGLCRSILNNDDDASDAAQDAFVDAVLHIDRYRPGTNLNAWIMRIAVHKCYGLLRRRRVRQQLQKTMRLARPAPPSAPSPDVVYRRDQDRAKLHAAIKKLSAIHQIVITLRYFNELTIKEIAEMLDVPEGTVRSRLHHGLRNLRTWAGQSNLAVRPERGES